MEIKKTNTRKYKVLISQEKPISPNSPYLQLANDYNLDLNFKKLVKILPISSGEFRKYIPQIYDSSAIIFTSRIAIDHFFSLCKDIKIEIDCNMKYFCITQQVANYLQNYINFKKRKVFTGSKSPLDLIPYFKKHITENYLFPCSEHRNNNIFSFFDTLKKKLNLIIVHNTVANDLADVNLSEYHLITLFSPSDVSSLINNFKPEEFKNIIFATFGQSTTKELEKMGFKPSIEAPTVQAPSMAKAMNLYFDKILEKY